MAAAAPTPAPSTTCHCCRPVPLLLPHRSGAFGGAVATSAAGGYAWGAEAKACEKASVATAGGNAARSAPSALIDVKRVFAAPPAGPTYQMTPPAPSASRATLMSQNRGDTVPQRCVIPA